MFSNSLAYSHLTQIQNTSRSGWVNASLKMGNRGVRAANDPTKKSAEGFTGSIPCSSAWRKQMEALRLLVADEHEIVRKGLRALLEAPPGWHVAGEASDGREAVEKAKELHPDVTVLDIGMPSLNGLEATRQMLKNDARAKILILTMHESDPLIRDVLDAGARGYVLKTDASRDLVTAVNAVRSNKTFFTAKVAQMVLDGYLDKGPKKEKPQAESPKTRLTPRQREIVQLLAEGKSSKEVAVQLGLSVKTAETHRANIMQRFNCHSVSELVRYAVRNNIIEA